LAGYWQLANEVGFCSIAIQLFNLTPLTHAMAGAITNYIVYTKHTP